jgi:hypothetical protein
MKINNVIDGFLRILAGLSIILIAPAIGVAIYAGAEGVTFGHVAWAILGAGIFAMIGFSQVIPKSGYFSQTNKIDTLRTATTYGEYSHPLLDETYVNKGQYMDALEKIAQTSYSKSIDDLPQELLDNLPEEFRKELAQRRVLAKEYEREKAERSPSHLFIYPLFVALFGATLGFITNGLLFNVQNLLINIIFMIIGILAFLLFVVMAISYSNNIF